MPADVSQRDRGARATTCGSSAASSWTTRRPTWSVCAALQAQIAARRLDGSDAAHARGHAAGRARRRRARRRALPRHRSTRHWRATRCRQARPCTGRSPQDALAAELPRVFDELREKDQPHALGGGWALPVAVRTPLGRRRADACARGAQPDRRARHRRGHVSHGGSRRRRPAAARLARLRAALPAGRWPPRGRVLVADDVPPQRLPVRRQPDRPLFDRRPHARPAVWRPTAAW